MSNDENRAATLQTPSAALGATAAAGQSFGGRSDGAGLEQTHNSKRVNRFTFLSDDPKQGQPTAESIANLVQSLPAELSPSLLSEKFPQLRNVKAFERLVSLSSSASKRSSVLALPENLVSNRQAFFEQEVIRELSELEGSKDWYDVQKYIESYLHPSTSPNSSYSPHDEQQEVAELMSSLYVNGIVEGTNQLEYTAYNQFTDMLLSCEESLTDLNILLVDLSSDNAPQEYLSAIISNIEDIIRAPQAAQLNIANLSRIKGALIDMCTLSDDMKIVRDTQEREQKISKWKLQIKDFILTVDEHALTPIRDIHMKSKPDRRFERRPPGTLSSLSPLHAEWIQTQAFVLGECYQYITKHTTVGQRSKIPFPLLLRKEFPIKEVSMSGRKTNVKSYNSIVPTSLSHSQNKRGHTETDSSTPLTAYTQTLIEFGRYLTRGTLLCQLYNELVCEKYPRKLQDMGVAEDVQQRGPYINSSYSQQSERRQLISRKKDTSTDPSTRYTKISHVIYEGNAHAPLHERLDWWIKFSSACRQSLNIDWNESQTMPFGFDPVEIAMCSDIGRQQAQMALIIFLCRVSEMLCLETPPVSRQDVDRLFTLYHQLKNASSASSTSPTQTPHLQMPPKPDNKNNDMFTQYYVITRPLTQTGDVTLAFIKSTASVNISGMEPMRTPVIVQRIEMTKQHVLSLRTKLDALRDPPASTLQHQPENSLRSRVALSATAQWYIRRLKRILVMLDTHKQKYIATASTYWPSTMWHTSFKLSSSHILDLGIDDTSTKKGTQRSNRRAAQPAISPLMNLLLTAPSLYFELPILATSQVHTLASYLTQHHSFAHVPNPKNANEWIVHRDKAYSTNRMLLKLFKDIADALMYLHEEWNLAHGLLSPDTILVTCTEQGSDDLNASSSQSQPTVMLCVPSMNLLPPKSFLEKPSHRDSMIFGAETLGNFSSSKENEDIDALMRALNDDYDHSGDESALDKSNDAITRPGLGLGKYDSTLAQDVRLFGLTIQTVMRPHWYIRPTVVAMDAQTAAISSSAYTSAAATPIATIPPSRHASFLDDDHRSSQSSSLHQSDQTERVRHATASDASLVAMPADEATRRTLRKSKSMKLRTRPVTIHLAPSIHPPWSPLYTGYTSIVHHPSSPKEELEVPSVSPTWVQAHLRGSGISGNTIHGSAPYSPIMSRSFSLSIEQGMNGLVHAHSTPSLGASSPTTSGRWHSLNEINTIHENPSSTEPKMLPRLSSIDNVDTFSLGFNSKEVGFSDNRDSNDYTMSSSAQTYSNFDHELQRNSDGLNRSSASLSLRPDTPRSDTPQPTATLETARQQWAAEMRADNVDEKDIVMKTITRVMKDLVARMIQDDEEKRPVIREVLSWL